MDQDEGNQICDWCAQKTDASLAQCVWIRCPSCGKAPYHEVWIADLLVACLEEWLRKIKYKRTGSRSEACYRSGLGSYPCPAGKGEIPRPQPCKCKVEMTIVIPMKSAKADLKKAARIEAVLRQQRLAAAAGHAHAAIPPPTPKLKPAPPRPALNCEIRRGSYFLPCPLSRPAAVESVPEALTSPEPKVVPGAEFVPEVRGKNKARTRQRQQQQQQQHRGEGGENQPTGAEWGDFVDGAWQQQRPGHGHDRTEAHHTPAYAASAFNPAGGLHPNYPPATHLRPEPDPLCAVRDITSAFGVHVKLEPPGSSQRGHCLLQLQAALEGLAAQGFDVASLSTVVCEQLEALAASMPCSERDSQAPAAHPSLALPAAEPLPRQASPLLPAPAPWPMATPTPILGGGCTGPQAGGWLHPPSGFAPAAPQPTQHTPHTPALPPLPAASRHPSIEVAGREDYGNEQQEDEDEEDSDLHLELLALCLPCNT